MEAERTVGLTGAWDRRISRRTLLRTGGSAAAGYFLWSGAAAAAPPPSAGPYPFTLGVASGDPSPDGFVLWTRLAPQPLAGGGMDGLAHPVRYEIATDESFRRILRRGAAMAVPDEAHSVHAEVAGLQPDTWYWYRFKFGSDTSPPGRTRTAPALGSSPPALAFAFVSCQNYTHGYYTAFADLAGQDDIELVVHLGDYIYEGNGVSANAVRPHIPRAVLMSLEDYRTRYAQYKTDRDLQAAHAACPWLLTWDDHEVANNYANLDFDNPDLPLDVAVARRTAAYRAYWEHMPLSRARKPVGKDLPLYRREPWGDLASFHVLDTRQYRDDQPAACTAAQRDPASGYCPGQLDPARTIMGAGQRDWLFEGLSDARPAWHVLANQVGFAAQRAGSSRSFGLVDSWDGYVADRQRVLDFVAERKLGNLVVITGDKHQNSVRNVAARYTDIAGPVVTTEFVGTSITSEGDFTGGTPAGPPANPQILWEDFQRGYVRVDLDRDVWHSRFRVVKVALPLAGPATVAATWMVENGRPGAIREGV